MQAVSRLAEGIEPRKSNDGKDDAFTLAEVNTGEPKCAWLGPLPRGRRPWHV